MAQDGTVRQAATERQYFFGLGESRALAAVFTGVYRLYIRRLNDNPSVAGKIINTPTDRRNPWADCCKATCDSIQLVSRVLVLVRVTQRTPSGHRTGQFGQCTVQYCIVLYCIV